MIVADLAFIEHTHPLDSSTRKLLDSALDAAAETIDATDLITSDPTGLHRRVDQLPLVSWYTDIATAVNEAMNRWHIEGADTTRRIEFNLPKDSCWGDEMHRIISSTIGAGASPLIRGTTREIQKVMDMSTSGPMPEVRLTTAGSAPWVAYGEWVAIGSPENGQPAALCHSPRFASVVSRFFNTEF